MADQGISYRRGPVQEGYSRAQPTGLPTGAESYTTTVLAGNPVQGSNLGAGPFHLRNLQDLDAIAVYDEDAVETVTISETLTTVATHTVSILESVGVSETVDETSLLALQLPESVASMEGQIVEWVGNVIVLENPLISESVAWVQSGGISLPESVPAAESVTDTLIIPPNPTILDTVFLSDTVLASHTQTAAVSDTVSVSDAATPTRLISWVVAETILIDESVSSGDGVVQPDESGFGATWLFPQDVERSKAGDLTSYRVISLDGSPPVLPTSVQYEVETLVSGSAGTLVGLTQVLVDTSYSPAFVRRYLRLASEVNAFTAQIVDAVASGPNTVLSLDRHVTQTDPQDGSVPWFIETGAVGITLGTTRQLVEGQYQITGSLADLVLAPKILVSDFGGYSPRPELVSVQFEPESGSVVLTFNRAMRVDPTLLDPNEYNIVGPGPVTITSVRSSGPGVVVLETSGFQSGEYQLVVNAAGTPKDDIGNPISPIFNTAIFGGVTPLTPRSLFTDKGPIVRPPLVLMQGTGVSFQNHTTVTLTGGLLSSGHTGKYLTLSGTVSNNGQFKILEVQTPTRCVVVASFSLPDAGAGAATWTVTDLRTGQIADDPAHVAVRINNVPVEPEAVIGLLGQVVLPSVPAPTDTVEIDYSWVCNPVVDVQRLNSREFRLNTWNQDTNLLPGFHHYRYNNVLANPSDYVDPYTVQSGSNASVTFPNIVDLPTAMILASFVGLTLVLGGLNSATRFRIDAVNTTTQVVVSPNPVVDTGASWAVLDELGNLLVTLDQPLQRDLKYRAFERAYTAVLNDPNLLVLNTPIHQVAYPPLERTVDEFFASYDPLTVPDTADPPWLRYGTGSASLSGGRLVVQDTSGGPFPAGQPIYWARGVDLTFPTVFAMAWQMDAAVSGTPQGVWTGIAAGYSDAEKVLVVGLLNDAGTRKVGVLLAGSGDDPSSLAAWGGGVDVNGNPTGLPVDLDWTVERSYRVFRDTAGVIRVYLDGEVVEALRILPEDLPYLEELNDPFNALQGVFFGSLSREATNQSTWEFVRYTVLPTNPMQVAPSLFASYEATDPPETSNPPWTPVGYHGTETILTGSHLLLDSWSATDAATEAQVGLVGGDFRAFVRLEPLLSVSSTVVLDVSVALLTHTQGYSPNGLMAAIDDGDRLTQLSFLTDRTAPLISYGGRSLPTETTPIPWQTAGTSTAAMAGRVLRITDSSATDGRLFFREDSAPVADPDRVLGSGFDFVVEFRVKAISYTPDAGGFCGATVDVYDSSRTLGVLLRQVAGVRYLAFHSDGVVISQVAFEWFDGLPHTYRLTKNVTGNLVTLFVDGVFVGSELYSAFTVPTFDPVGVLSFGSSTASSLSAQSVMDWNYCNAFRLLTGIKRHVGFWKGSSHGNLLDYHVPVKASGSAASVAGNGLSDPLASFVAAGVVAGDLLLIRDGTNQGVYEIASVTPTVLTTTTVFPSSPSQVHYEVARETDWSVQKRYRIVRGPNGTVTLLIDTDTTPSIQVNYSSMDLPSSLVGVPRIVSNGLPSIVFGALDPTALSQSRWDSVRYGITRSPSELRIVPPHQVLNQRNGIASPEHIFTQIPHTHVDFWAGSDGIPPALDPDFLRNGSLVAYTLLNEGTPLVPLTQTAEARGITSSSVFVSSLNTPEDVLNNDGDFTTNDGSTKTELVYPPDVLYNALEVLETQTGVTDLISSACDDCGGPNLAFAYLNEVCLTYDGSVLPENDTAAPTAWELVSDIPANVTASVSLGILTYGTLGSTKTVYKNPTPLTDQIGLVTRVTFVARVVQDTTLGLGDSQIRLGFSAVPNVTVGLAFQTMPTGDRYVVVKDLNNGAVFGGILFDWYDGLFHTYRITRDPAVATLIVEVDP